MAAPNNAHAKNEPLSPLMRESGRLFAHGPAQNHRTFLNQTLYIRLGADCHHKIFEKRSFQKL
jgi:hypothetical protein